MLDQPYIDALYTLSNKRDDEFRQSLSIVIGLTVFLVLKLDPFRQVFQIMLLFICLSMCQSHNADHKAEEGTKQKKEEIHR